MKKQLVRYLERHYDTFPDQKVESMITEAVERLAAKDFLSMGAILASVQQMRTEGWNSRKILAQLNIIDLEDRI